MQLGLSEGAIVEDIKISPRGEVVAVILVREAGKAEEIAQLRERVQGEIASLDGVAKAVVVLTSPERPVVPSGASALAPKSGLDSIQVIAVASGKGGVGKSTVAVNLAAALLQKGKKVGILDADIYGPSLPRLLNKVDVKAVQGADGRIVPVDAYGLKAMSMGFLVDEKTPMIWRGPMVQSALLQMIRDVVWDGLDILVIDLPPGTGDIHLTLAQKVPLAGGVVVSTPQDIALIDARKGLEMFRKVAVPILGIVENMSYYCCPMCGHRDNIFGTGGAQKEAALLGVPFLGAIPLHSVIRELSDAGTPVVLAASGSEQARAFEAIASSVLEHLGTSNRPAPRIAIED